MAGEVLWDPAVPVGQRRLARRAPGSAPTPAQVLRERARLLVGAIPGLAIGAVVALVVLAIVAGSAASSWLLLLLGSVLALLFAAVLGAGTVVTVREVRGARRLQRTTAAVLAARE